MTPPWEWRRNSFIFGGKAGYFLGTSLTNLQWVCLYQYHLEQPSSKVRSAGACCRLPLVRRVTALSGVFLPCHPPVFLRQRPICLASRQKPQLLTTSPILPLLALLHFCTAQLHHPHRLIVSSTHRHQHHTCIPPFIRRVPVALFPALWPSAARPGLVYKPPRGIRRPPDTALGVLGLQDRPLLSSLAVSIIHPQLQPRQRSTRPSARRNLMHFHTS